MHEDERKRGRKRKRERERERWVESERRARVYINKPREKAPKIIPREKK